MPRTRARGFTLVEAAVAVSIVLVLSALAYDTMRRSRPRATFNGVAAELRSLVHQARLQALSAGVPVAVLVFPQYASGESLGRIVVVQDDTNPAQSLLNSGAPLHIGNYAPGTLSAPANGQVITSIDLPRGVQVAGATILVTGLPFPYNTFTIDSGCPFCSGTPPRGAIVFDQRGRAKFYSGTASAVTEWTDPAGATGASLSITSTDLGTATTSTLVVTGAGGSVRTFNNG